MHAQQERQSVCFYEMTMFTASNGYVSIYNLLCGFKATHFIATSAGAWGEMDGIQRHFMS